MTDRERDLQHNAAVSAASFWRHLTNQERTLLLTIFRSGNGLHKLGSIVAGWANRNESALYEPNKPLEP